MRSNILTINFAVAAMGLNLGAASAAMVPFTETFNDGVNGWTDQFRDPATHVMSGGPDGSGFARTSFNFSDFAGGAFGGSLVVTRGEANDNASGGAFVGDWISDGIGRFTTQVRHDAGEDLNFFVRFASSFNFPGAIAGYFTVPSGEWTLLDVEIDPDGGPWVSFEGTDFDTVFGSVGNVQLGIDVPESFNMTDRTVLFDMDSPTIVPAPGPAALMGLGALLACGRRRRRAVSV